MKHLACAVLTWAVLGSWVVIQGIQGSSGFAPESDCLQPVQAVGLWARTPVFMAVPFLTTQQSQPLTGLGELDETVLYHGRFSRSFPLSFQKVVPSRGFPWCLRASSHHFECFDLLRWQEGLDQRRCGFYWAGRLCTPGHFLLHVMSWRTEQLSVSWARPLISPSSLSSTCQMGRTARSDL